MPREAGTELPQRDCILAFGRPYACSRSTAEETVSGAIVLITEDEPVIRAFARLIVQDAGHHSLEAASVEEAIGLIKSNQPVDVLFTDIHLRPVADGGLELAKEAIKLLPSLRVIYTTGRMLTDRMRATFVEGARFLPKPYTPRSLTETLADVLHP
jgi:CheY-like chemotaxis protein